MDIKQSDIDRFWEFFEVTDSNKCWIWTGGINSNGRGIFWLNGKTELAHRVSHEINIGKIPEGLWVLHRCDNGKCVNPNHLFLGTCLDNVRDMIAKGRKVTLRGSDDPKSKLIEEQVLRIRSLYQTSLLERSSIFKTHPYSQYGLAKMFGVSRSTIESIIHKDNWKHM